MKEKLDDIEVQNYRLWIEDAWKRWYSLRPITLTTIDKSASITAQDEEGFDPRSRLHKDELKESDYPEVQDTMYAVYDIYLTKLDEHIELTKIVVLKIAYNEEDTLSVYRMNDAKELVSVQGEIKEQMWEYSTDTLGNFIFTVEKSKEPPQNSDDPEPDPNLEPRPNLNPNDTDNGTSINGDQTMKPNDSNNSSNKDDKANKGVLTGEEDTLLILITLLIASCIVLCYLHRRNRGKHSRNHCF